MPGALVSRRAGVLAYAKQTGVGSPAAAPTYAVPKVTGGIAPVRERADLSITRPSQARAGQYISRARAEGSITILAHPDEVGLFLYLVCGSQSISGAGPYLHTFTVIDNIPNEPLTIWDLVGDDWMEFVDVFVTRCVIRGVSGENVVLELGLTGFQAGPVAAPTFTLAPDEPRFKYIGSDVMLDPDGATPISSTNVERVELVIDRSPDLRYGSSLTPEFFIFMRDVDFNTTLIYDPAQHGWDFMRVSQLGSAGATELEQGLTPGSFDVTFGRHPDDPAAPLRVASNGQVWEHDAPRPQSDPGGGAIELTAEGRVTQPLAGGPEVTVELSNDVSATY